MKEAQHSHISPETKWSKIVSLKCGGLVHVEIICENSLQTVLWHYGDLYCVSSALLGITFKQARIDAYREGYVESAVDDQGQGYRRVVWPTLELSPGPATWSRVEPQQMDKRNHELLFKAVFSVV